MNGKIRIGCVADDFTGASDAASFLRKGGLKTILYNGTPQHNVVPKDCQAIVIALKTRTQETKSAIEDTLYAINWLKEVGMTKFYIKYCSTFDSTKEGNIGPVVDAVMERLGIKSTILCPALPINKRIVKNGVLYVDAIPLADSHMKNHPLTPMWESKITKLMKPQGKYDCLELDYHQMYQAEDIVKKMMDDFGRLHNHFYVIPDFTSEEDAKKIIELFGHMELLTGGSGILTELAAYALENQKRKTDVLLSKIGGKAIIFAGSCSIATLSQIQRYKYANGKAIKINPLDLSKGIQTIEEIWKQILESKSDEILIYSSDTPEKVRMIQESGKHEIAELLEQTMGELAKLAVENGYNRMIVAGGETAGAVTKKLNFDAYHIGESIAPGVPILIPANNKDIRLILKSGNFGEDDFFLKALDMTGNVLDEKLNTAIWIAKSLFERGKVSGSSSNMSFEHRNQIYITGSGTCFGTLTKEDFAVINKDGSHTLSKKPSKEYPLHLALYHKDSSVKAVIHTHSFYSTLWSCLEHENIYDVMPAYTPYLKMRLGTVGLVPYAKPGSQELFAEFKKCINNSEGYLLKNHGPVVSGENLMSAFYNLEELEESAHIAWKLRKEGLKEI